MPPEGVSEGELIIWVEQREKIMSVDPWNLAAVSSLRDEWRLHPREWVSAIELRSVNRRFERAPAT